MSYPLAHRAKRATRAEGTNLDVRGVLLHAWLLWKKIFALCIYITADGTVSVYWASSVQ